MSDATPSFSFYPDLLPELRGLVGQYHDPLTEARIAMTCRAEDKRRREWYWSRMSGVRSRESYVRGILRDGSDNDARDLFDHALIGRDYPFLVEDALSYRRDVVVLDWIAAMPARATTIVKNPLQFNSRLAAVRALGLLKRAPPQDICAINEYWDVKEGRTEPVEINEWLVPWAIEHEKRDLLLNFRRDHRMNAGWDIPAGVSLDFVEFLIDAGYIRGDVAMRWRFLPHLKIAVRHFGTISPWIMWRSDTLERDAWVAKERGYNMVEGWRDRCADIQREGAPARDLIAVMEYHGLPWTRTTLLKSIDDRDYAAVVWHLKRPTLCAHTWLRIDVAGWRSRLLDDLLAHGWLVRDAAGQLAFSALLPETFVLNVEETCVS